MMSSTELSDQSPTLYPTRDVMQIGTLDPANSKRYQNAHPCRISPWWLIPIPPTQFLSLCWFWTHTSTTKSQSPSHLKSNSISFSTASFLTPLYGSHFIPSLFVSSLCYFISIFFSNVAILYKTRCTCPENAIQSCLYFLCALSCSPLKKRLRCALLYPHSRPLCARCLSWLGCCRLNWLLPSRSTFELVELARLSRFLEPCPPAIVTRMCITSIFPSHPAPYDLASAH